MQMQQTFRSRGRFVHAPTRRIARHIRAAATPGSSATGAAQAEVPQKKRLLYDAIAFDMDGTLGEAHIPFEDMRRRTGIPVGDLFVAMESWEEPERIKASMDVILEIEAEAAKTVAAKEGLMDLLQMLKESDVKVALVTRNTISSVAAFFKLVGEEWRELFSEIRTREFRYVKPDKRLLLDLAQAWQLHPGRLLMVGDSFEDVEVGNAAGTATCLVTGGGNEAPGSNIGPPPGAIPTFSVNSLTQLRQFLLDTAPKSDIEGAQGRYNVADGPSSASSSIDGLDSSSLGLLGWSLRSSSESESDDEDAFLWLDPATPGAPAPGLDFMDYLVLQGAITTATTSFPKMGAAAGGLQACAQGGGDSVLHVGYGDGALTKMLASKGLQVVGVDSDITAGIKRGLRCVAFDGHALSAGSLAAAAAAGRVDAVLVYTGPTAQQQGFSSAEALSAAALQEYKQVLKPGGCLCVEVPLAGSSSGDSMRGELQAAGYAVECLELVAVGPGAQQRMKLVARLPPVTVA